MVSYTREFQISNFKQLVTLTQDSIKLLSLKLPLLDYLKTHYNCYFFYFQLQRQI